MLNDTDYPPQPDTSEKLYGLFPVDFYLDAILRAGLVWFRDNPGAPALVFGHLKSPWLSTKYGESKINEIAAYIRQYEIKIVQNWSLIPQAVPCISIQLLDGGEDVSRAGLGDHREMLDTLTSQDDVLGRTEVGYIPVSDQIHIGIHAAETPDLTKYLYFLVAYILSAFKPELQKIGMVLTTFRASDLSRANEFLPENIFSRFINFSAFSMASFDMGMVPIVNRILGVHIPLGDDATSEVDSDTGLEIETGVRFADTNGG